MKSKIKIVLLDDHKVVSAGISSILKDHGSIEVLDSATSEEQLKSLLICHQPDILVVDYSFGKGKPTGLEVIERLMPSYPKVKFLMLTMHDQNKVVLQAIQLGVHGYMLKSETDFEIAKAIMNLSEKGCYFSPEILALATQGIRDFNKVTVSNREYEVLKTLYKGFTAKEAGELLFISPHTVETHRKNLINRFEAKNVTHLIYLALNHGILGIRD